ncbi:MAG TPA: FlgD immunoglobulin-like domain containing protein [Candidatus Syntrophosphaera sp.]|jgi:hypothetical protein|nr:FlgD immunoglobulin-like domain containing protein [Candidatus Syntrophosphaera sp.]
MPNLKVIVSVLCLLLASLGSLSAQFSGGSGTEADPYQIATPTDLDNIRNYCSSHFLQTADISLDVAPYNENQGWIPIVSNQSAPFSGSYNGNGHAIHHLYINDPSLNNAGLFRLLMGATLINIRLLDVDITCHSTGGALLGKCAQSEVTSCFASGQITGSDQDMGGMFGHVIGSTVSQCVTDMVVSGGHYAAGLAGWVEEECAFSDCGALGTVTGLDSCGGLIGDMMGSTLSRSYARSEITGLMVIGGLVGTCQESSTITDCFARCQITANGFPGGISGTTHEGSALTNCYSASSFAGGSTTADGITGGTANLSIVACYWDSDLAGPLSNSFGEGRTTAEMTYPHAANTYVGWDFAAIWHSDDSGTQNAGYPYLWAEPSGAGDEALTPLPVRVSNHPNPFRKETVLLCKTDQPEEVSLSIYNLKGQRVRQLPSGFAVSGEYRVSWDGKDDQGMNAASGIYLLRFTQGGRSLTHRLMLIK